MPVPDDVHHRYALAIADEIASEMRHEAVNAFGALSALSFHLWRRIGTAFPEVPASADLSALFRSLNDRATSSAEALEIRFLDGPCNGARSDLRAALAHATSVMPVRLVISDETSCEVAMDGTDLSALLLGLLCGARTDDGVVTTVEPLAESPDRVVARIAPTPFAAKAFDVALASDPASLGVRVARRLAHRWAGDLRPIVGERPAEGLVLELPVARSRAG